MNQNQLADEPSPYLRQHADNPVHWWPWGDEAFAEAARRDVPIFLSIGYATCHWCHVMAHESFEDDDVAALMNEAFVCIKVDREERPDIDATYMATIQAAGQRGGWPLTAVLDHEKRPWFLGTYIPKETRGRLGMMELVPRLAAAWKDNREELLASAEDLLKHAAPATAPAARDAITLELFDGAVAALHSSNDPEHGGFGRAPKFPSPHQIMLLLRHFRRTGNKQSLSMVETTLDAMARGGLHDHVAGGFHRYSTDRDWHVPHFEKMLYDQAMLMMAYTEAYQVTGASRFAAVVDDIASYVMRDLRHKDGGFYCAEDADSEGEEGTFYIWTAAELEQVLGDDAADFMTDFGCLPNGNFKDEATGQQMDTNILHLRQGVEPESHRASLQQLHQVRNKRERPLLDDKILTDWNGLMIAALAKAGAALERPEFLVAAEEAANFIAGNLRTTNGELLHRWHEGRTDSHAFLDDHAFLAWGYLELFAATQAPRWLSLATDVANKLRSQFQESNGALRLTAKTGENMVLDSTTAYDGAIPSGTSIAVQVFERLGRITADAQWTNAAWQAAENVDGIVRHPSAFNALVASLPALLGEGMEVVVTGDGKASDLIAKEMRKGFHPDAVWIHRGASAVELPEWVLAHSGTEDAAYVCRNQSCDAPVNDVASVRTLLQT